MHTQTPPSLWQRWLKHPQKAGFRKLLFQIHLWSGIILGLYIFFISITGSVLVYRNELYRMVIPEPDISASTGTLLSDTEITQLALTLYPEYDEVSRLIRRGGDDNLEVELWLANDDKLRKRFFDPVTGADAGSASTAGITTVSTLIELHENFLAGSTGRSINGVAAIAIVLIAFTGLILWWPGVSRWKQSLVLTRGVNWRRQIWNIHSVAGFWCFGFILLFAVTGIYLSFSSAFHSLSELIQPMTDENAGRRLVDKILYWLAYLHFGRINGIGIPCDGPGLCDQTVKATWAFFGLAPGVMIVTGTIMWWNRSLRRRFRKT